MGKMAIRWLVLAVPLAAGIAAPTFALVATAADVKPAPTPKPDEPSPGAKLAAAINAELAKQAPDQSAEQLEAVIVFAISQGNYTPTTVDDALSIVAGTPDISDALKQAISNVKTAYAKKKVNTGTAAIGDGGRGFGGTFSSPGANISGGSTNYS